MKRIVLLLLVLFSATSVHAEKNLQRPPGTTRYAQMVSRLKALEAYDRQDGQGRMSLFSIGQSVQGRSIWMVKLQGSSDDAAPSDDPQSSSPAASPAPKRLLYICRQHGHEPASTEAALDFVDELVHAEPGSAADGALKAVTIYVIPMANPDGAEAFLRHNAHDVDLNRDWIRQTQPETRALVAAIRRIHPDLMTDQHELYPDDTRPDFTETAGPKSGANASVIATCGDLQPIVSAVMTAEGSPSRVHWIDDSHPARLAHRYGCVVLGIPTILFETNRSEGGGRTVAMRAQAHKRFMSIVLRYAAGQRDALMSEIEHAAPAASLAGTAPPAATSVGE